MNQAGVGDLFGTTSEELLESAGDCLCDGLLLRENERGRVFGDGEGKRT